MENISSMRTKHIDLQLRLYRFANLIIEIICVGG